MKRLRIGVQGRVLWRKVRITPIAIDADEALFNETKAFFKNQLDVWDGKDLGHGFRFFLTWT